MRKDTVFINAVCKAEELSLLSGDALLRLSAASFDDCLKMLHDYGYNEGIYTSGSFDIDEFIRRQVDLHISFVKEYSFSDAFEQFMLAPYLFNNIKAEYKHRRGGDKSRLYDVAIDYNDATVVRAIKYMDEQPEISSGDIDRILTNAMYEYKMLRAEKCGKLLKRYLKAEIDLTNLMTAGRLKRLKLEGDELFIKGGTMNKFIYDKADLPCEYAELYIDDPVKLERQADEYLLHIALKHNGDMNSMSPMLSFVLKKNVELRTVKMILVCIKSDARSEIASRIRGEV